MDKKAKSPKDVPEHNQDDDSQYEYFLSIREYPDPSFSFFEKQPQTFLNETSKKPVVPEQVVKIRILSWPIHEKEKK